LYREIKLLQLGKLDIIQKHMDRYCLGFTVENYFLGFRQKKYFLGFRKLVSGVWAQKSGVLGFRMYVSWGLGSFVP